jgi:hypothetical protein
MVVVAGGCGSRPGSVFSVLWGYKRSQRPSCAYEALGRRKYLDEAFSVSDLRRHTRRRGVGLNEHQVERSLTQHAEIPTALDRFERGSIKVLTGPLGSGMSEITEEWFRARIADARTRRDAAIPIWLRIDELGTVLEDSVVAEIGREALRRVGSDVVIDGLDERTQKAGSARRQAEEFVNRSPNSRVLLTSRALPPTASEVGLGTHAVIDVPLLTTEASATLMNTVAGQTIGPFGDQLLEAVHRPFFALLVARHATAARGATGIPELIDLVVHDVVTAGSADGVGRPAGSYQPVAPMDTGIQPCGGGALAARRRSITV